MENILTNYLTQIIAWLESGAGFIQKEMPLYIEELIRYKAIYLSINFFISLGVIIISSIVICSFTKKISHLERYDDRTDFFISGCIIASFVAIVAFIVFICFFDPFLKIHIAPRVYLIDYLKTIIQ